MPKATSVKGDSTEKLKGIQIRSLDDDDEVEEEEDDISEEENPYVTLGFLEKPKDRWCLLRQVFPSKAGGAPVLIFQIFKTPFLLFLNFFSANYYDSCKKTPSV
jgi:hypothetical protein